MCSEEDVQRGTIKAVQFGILSPEETLDISRVQIEFQDSLGTDDQPISGGLLDYRMGPMDRGPTCQTCEGNNRTCHGHFGYIRLPKPVFLFGYMQDILDVLRCICPHCSRVLLSRRDHRYRSVSSIKEPESRMQALIKICDKFNKCYFPVKGSVAEGCGKMLAKYKYGENVKIVAQFPIAYPEFSDDTKFILTAEKVDQIFEKIDAADYPMLGFDGVNAKPQWMILKLMPVSPNCLRPSNRSNAAARKEDDVTEKLSQIIHACDILQQYLDDYHSFVGQEESRSNRSESQKPGGKTRDERRKALENNIMMATQVLQIHVSLYHDSKSVNAHQKFVNRSNKKIKGRYQALSHKEGLFRGNLMGKRDDQTARSVISPDPYLGLNEVAVPKSIARNLTKSPYVNRLNIKLLEELVRNGPHAVRGANAVITEDNRRIDLKFAPIESVLPLKYGMKVERHLMDGDLVTYNRQPSLHRMSYMGHRVRVMNHSTFRMNSSTTTPYNADFDGDEMNLCVDQCPEAEAELSELMLVEKNFLAPANGRPCMAVIQDTLLGARMMSIRDCFFDRPSMMQLIGFLKTWDGTIPTPAVLKPKQLWTGKQLLSCIIPRLNYHQHCLDFPESERQQIPFSTDSKASKSDNLPPSTGDPKSLYLPEDVSPSDSSMLIVRGELLRGHFCKKTIGSSANSLIHVLLKDFGTTVNRLFVEDIQMLAREYMMMRGFTMSNGDMPVDRDIRKKAKDNLKLIEQEMEKWKRKKISVSEYETRINKMVEDARGNIAKDLMSKLPHDNNFKYVLTAGSKGTSVNPATIMVCWGQANVEDRVCPQVQRFDDNPVVKGFTYNNLMNGLSPMEYWNLSMAGREGLIDTAVKTSETGYLQRRLTKALEDVAIKYDRTVRDSQGNIIQFSFGGDGLDGSFNEFHDYEPYKMTKEQFIKSYFWDKESPLLKKESQRLENDWFLLQETRSVYKTFTTPVHFRRLLDNLPFGSTECSRFTSAEEMVQNVIDLQLDLWKLIPEVECPWDTKFAMLLRISLCSKKMCLIPKMTEANWRWTLQTVREKFARAVVQPGEMVGLIAGQALGEPATQMTLNVFHFVGVSEKNIPLGVPRLKELVNNAKSTKNPSMTIYLKESVRGNKLFVESFAKSLEALYFEGIIEVEEILFDPDVGRTTVAEDEDLVKRFSRIPDFPELQEGTEWSQYMLRFCLKKQKMIDRDISMDLVVRRLRSMFDRTLLLQYSSEYDLSCILRIRVACDRKNPAKPGEEYFLLKELLKLIKKQVLVSHLDGIQRAFIKEDAANGEFLIETQGSNLRDVLVNPFVDGHRTYSNDISEIFQVLGLEAAITSIVREIQQVLTFYGIYVDPRHPQLLANLMGHRETIMGMTRHGMKRMKKGALIKASFEETSVVLHNAARFCRKDRLKGVSEAIMTGKVAPIGTGTFSLFLDTDKIKLSRDVTAEEDLEKAADLMIPSLRDRVIERSSATVADLMKAIDNNRGFEPEEEELHRHLTQSQRTFTEASYGDNHRRWINCTPSETDFAGHQSMPILNYEQQDSNWRPPSPDADEIL